MKIFSFILSITVAFFLSTFSATSYAQSMQVSGTMEISFDIPEGWNYDLNETSILISATDISLQINLVPLSKSDKDNPAAAIDRFVNNMAKSILDKTVEKKIDLKHIDGLTGSYASFTDASLVGKPIPKGEYKYITMGSFYFNTPGVIISLLSNDIESEQFKNALSIIKKIDYHKITPQEKTIIIPNQNWKLSFQHTVFDAAASSTFDDGEFTFKARTADGFHISIFVENKANDSSGNKACYNYYWPQAKQNPMINPKTISKKELEKFFLVSYRIAGENDNVKFNVPNTNLYFEHNNKWIDIHVSKYSDNKTDKKDLDEFIASVKYEDLEEK